MNHANGKDDSGSESPKFKVFQSPNKFKLVYFNLRGRAEGIRLCFHAAEVDFEDETVNFDMWKNMKPGTIETGLAKANV